ncbi:RibD family protein [Pseudobacteriovorax antillogorgiicola]|uniref:RibD family protein n=1 Tax=Pseudobacteriovorax antillogorgiicola TaxID=1513793 RepID=UPI0013564A13|nr:RibD family protein [Pseudobacteriovorax antillogorgiicola]
MREDRETPFVTLSFAQSLDACLSAEKDQSTKISDYEADILTHQIRAIHDGILVGINTILVDDPQLNVRLVEGPSPTAVVLDPNLDTPTDSRIFKLRCKTPIICCDETVPLSKREEFQGATGANLLAGSFSEPFYLYKIMSKLKNLEIKTLMVEGGGRTIHDFLQNSLVNYFVVTLSPVFLGSQRSVRYSNFRVSLSGVIDQAQYQILGPDLIVYGRYQDHRASSEMVACP